MNFSNFLHRSGRSLPRLLAIILTLVGVVSMRVLPIEQYPSVVPPHSVGGGALPRCQCRDCGPDRGSPTGRGNQRGSRTCLYMTSTSADNGIMSLSVAF